MEEQPAATFRITPWRPWLLAITPLSLIAAAGAIASLVTDRLAALSITVLACTGLAVVLLLLVSAAVRVSRWHVDPHGIGGRNNSLVYRRLAWSEISSVEPWPIPGHRYLQVRDLHGRRAFWLPMFLTDMPGLRSAVARHAPPGNPLREYLAQHPR